MQSKLFIANWKSNKTVSEATDWIAEFSKQFAVLRSKDPRSKVILAPSLVHIPLVKELSPKLDSFQIAGQDVSHFPLGSYTGAVAADQLRDLGVTYCLVGHSERRRYFGETHQLVAQKIELLVASSIIPILCVDEKEIEQQADLLSAKLRNSCIVAYEPVTAIGTGMGQDISLVEPVVSQIKSLFGDVPVLYGGSVNSINISEYLFVTDGVLVGAVSLDPQKFFDLTAVSYTLEEQ